MTSRNPWSARIRSSVPGIRTANARRTFQLPDDERPALTTNARLSASTHNSPPGRVSRHNSRNAVSLSPAPESRRNRSRHRKSRLRTAVDAHPQQRIRSQVGCGFALSDSRQRIIDARRVNPPREQVSSVGSRATAGIQPTHSRAARAPEVGESTHARIEPGGLQPAIPASSSRIDANSSKRFRHPFSNSSLPARSCSFVMGLTVPRKRMTRAKRAEDGVQAHGREKSVQTGGTPYTLPKTQRGEGHVCNRPLVPKQCLAHRLGAVAARRRGTPFAPNTNAISYPIRLGRRNAGVSLDYVSYLAHPPFARKRAPE